MCHTQPMATRQPQAPGGRKIRHVVMVTPEQETALQQLAEKRGVTVSRLLVESALDPFQDTSALLVRQVAGLRKLLVDNEIDQFENDLKRLLAQ